MDRDAPLRRPWRVALKLHYNEFYLARSREPTLESILAVQLRHKDQDVIVSYHGIALEKTGPRSYVCAAVNIPWSAKNAVFLQ